MTPETIELARALKAVTANVENIATALLTGQMPPTDQRRFASLLHELAALLEEHAETEDRKTNE